MLTQAIFWYDKAIAMDESVKFARENKGILMLFNLEILRLDMLSPSPSLEKALADLKNSNQALPREWDQKKECVIF